MRLALNDKVVFLAGSSRGIGYATAKGFLQEGAKVVLSGRDRDKLLNASDALSIEFGDKRVYSICGDLSDTSVLIPALDEVEQNFGNIFSVVANIGNGTGPKGIRLANDDWLTALNENLLAATRLASEALYRLENRGEGSMTFVTSIAGIEEMGAPTPYATAKAGLLMAMKSYARQVGHAGVRVNAIAPGNVLFPGGTWARKLEEEPELTESYIEQEVALRRFATPKEIANVLVFLASDRSSFVSGSVWVVDGGQLRSAR